MASYRFHKAAKDGNIEILKEATRRDCNARDEDGMTPTLWASFEGHLDALRLLVGRGGDVDKADHFGNTSLHFAAARGHMHCVTFLANFGANLWALDIDFHTPKELAAMNNRDDILRFLDGATAKEENKNRKAAKAMRDKAQKEAEKRNKEYDKLKVKADMLAEQERRRLQKEREKMEKEDQGGVSIMLHRPSTVLMALKMKSQGGGKGNLFTNGGNMNSSSPQFSDIVSSGTGQGQKKTVSGVQKKVQQKMKSQANGGDFKVGEAEADGKRSVRSLSGLRRDSEILYVGSYDNDATGKRGKISDVFDETQQGPLVSSRALSATDFMNADSGYRDEVLLHEQGSIFDRPGFGSVAFRNSISATLSTMPRFDQLEIESFEKGSGAEDCSIGSAGSLAQRQQQLPWDQDDVQSDEEEIESMERSPLHLFLMSSGLGDQLPRFQKEQIDMDALMLLTDEDLQSIGLLIGPRRKLIKAISDRRAAMENPGDFQDSRL